MAETPPDDGSFWKTVIFIIGTAAGVGAKLASMHKVKPITMADVVVNSAIAFAAAFLVYHLLHYNGYGDAAIVASVLCGRFADDILTVSWRFAKRYIKITNDELNGKK